MTYSALYSARKGGMMEATSGFEPLNRGFAVLRRKRGDAVVSVETPRLSTAPLLREGLRA